jgi:ABC-2 type transport system ATP-binding protein
MDTAPLIQVSDLVKTFRVFKRRPGVLGGLRTLFSNDSTEIRAVDGISLTIAAGELVGYLGPNGAGKSTTIKMLTGILHPTSGQVLVNGIIPYRDRVRNSSTIGVIFGQRSLLIWDLPPRDTFELLRRMYAIPKARYAHNLEQFVRLLELQSLIDRPVRQLSLGQRMRCELVAALLHDPPIVYLDEPTIGLDVVAKEQIRQFILQLNQERGATVILTTHDLQDVEKLCRRVIIIDSGRVIYDGTLTAIKRQYGRWRQIVFSVADGEQTDSLVNTLAGIDAQIRIERRQDGSVVVGFDPQAVAASELTRQIVNNYAVTDLTVAEADIEAIIRAIYSQGSADAA